MKKNKNLKEIVIAEQLDETNRVYEEQNKYLTKINKKQDSWNRRKLSKERSVKSISKRQENRECNKYQIEMVSFRNDEGELIANEENTCMLQRWTQYFYNFL